MVSAAKHLYDYKVKACWSIYGERGKQHRGCTHDSAAISTKTAGWIMQKPYSPLCLILHCFLQSKEPSAFLLSHVIPGCHPVFQTIKTVLNVAKLSGKRTFRKSEAICKAALVENVFCSRQNFPSVLSTEKFTDFSQWNLLEFIGSWLAVTD